MRWNIDILNFNVYTEVEFLITENRMFKKE